MDRTLHLTLGLTSGVYVHPSEIFHAFDDAVKKRTFEELPEDYQTKLATLMTCTPTTTINGFGWCLKDEVYWLDVTRESWEAL